ncbi:hypothetical protein Tco_1270175 [Tanacetum coccineum]
MDHNSRKLTLKLHILIIPYPERREIHRVQVFDFRGLPDLMTKGLSTKMLMKHKDAQGQSIKFKFGEAILDLDTPGALQFQLGTAPSYTFIRDYMLRLCHRLIACSIAGRSQAPKKGLTVIAPALPIINMVELVRLQLCVKLDDTWAWVPAGLARQEGGAGGVAKEALVAPGGGDEDEEMPQAVPPPPRTQGKRITRLEKEVHDICEGRCALHEIFIVTSRVPEMYQAED